MEEQRPIVADPAQDPASAYAVPGHQLAASGEGLDWSTRLGPYEQPDDNLIYPIQRHSTPNPSVNRVIAAILQLYSLGIWLSILLGLPLMPPNAFGWHYWATSGPAHQPLLAAIWPPRRIPSPFGPMIDDACRLVLNNVGVIGGQHQHFLYSRVDSCWVSEMALRHSFANYVGGFLHFAIPPQGAGHFLGMPTFRHFYIPYLIETLNWLGGGAIGIDPLLAHGTLTIQEYAIHAARVNWLLQQIAQARAARGLQGTGRHVW